MHKYKPTPKHPITKMALIRQNRFSTFEQVTKYIHNTYSHSFNFSIHFIDIDCENLQVNEFEEYTSYLTNHI